MSEQKKSDEKILSSLMKKYSISEIISKLSEIDEKIISLHKCSSEDFLNLNEHFKRYHKESKKLSDNASQIVAEFTEKEGDNLYLNLKNVNKGFGEIIAGYNDKINLIIEHLKNLSRQIDQVFIPANNYKQNIMTLKFLVTNIKLGDALNLEGNKQLPENIEAETDSITSKIKETYNSFDEQLNKIASRINDSIIKIKDIKGNNVKNIESFINQVDSSIEILANKHSIAKAKIPQLSENTSLTSTSISNIITNLQYQDIIRQKIEHIQQSHKNIIKELSLMEMMQDDKAISHSKLKTFIQIRDITGLQAAQLIHANKQYQEAIQNITDKFQIIGENMSNISKLCNEISGQGESSNLPIYNEISSKLQSGQKNSEKLINDHKTLFSELKSIDNDIKILIKELENIEPTDKNLEKIVKVIIECQPSTEEGDEIITQITNLHQTLAQNQKEIAKGFKASLDSCTLIQTEIAELNGISSLEDIAAFNSEFNAILDDIESNGENINGLLKENETISENAITEIKQAFKEVKYYEFFEKVIEKIINELNIINLQLKLDEGEMDDIQKTKNLEQIKKLYTMNSEHVIHEKISRGENVTEIFNDEELNTVNTDEDDDNLELF